MSSSDADGHGERFTINVVLSSYFVHDIEELFQHITFLSLKFIFML